jgi:hypothetical protein
MIFGYDNVKSTILKEEMGPEVALISSKGRYTLHVNGQDSRWHSYAG